jgi:hypothetical protein
MDRHRRMIGICKHCETQRGPWEDESCPVLRAEQGWQLNVPDLAVYVLEQSETPLTIYDIKRSIRRDFGIDVNQNTLQVHISADLRFCWAGRSLYGLYRHGLIPGPRSLAGIARMFLYSHGPLKHASLEFAMKYTGYRFQSSSLNSALNYAAEVFWLNSDGGWYWDTARTPEAAQDLRKLGIAATEADFDLVAARCAETVRVALAERERRLCLWGGIQQFRSPLSNIHNR